MLFQYGLSLTELFNCGENVPSVQCDFGRCFILKKKITFSISYALQKPQLLLKTI